MKKKKLCDFLPDVTGFDFYVTFKWQRERFELQADGENVWFSEPNYVWFKVIKPKQNLKWKRKR